MDLFTHQKKFLKENPAKAALVWSCGTGKSRAALEWSKLGGDLLALVICPKALKTNWEREADKWGAKIAVFTKEEFRRDWDVIPRVDQIIVDEVHNGFLTPHFKSQMSKALRNYLKKHKTPRVLLLSATVYTSSPWNIFNLAFFLGHKLSWMSFDRMFFTYIRMGPRLVPQIRKGSEVELAKLTKEIANVVDIYDCMDVPLQHHMDPEYFALTKNQQTGIKKNYDSVPIVRFTHQHEIENGVLVGNEFREGQVFDCDKIDRLKDIVAENSKVAIVCRYNAQIDVLKKELRDRRGGEPVVIRGDVKDRDSICVEAERALTAVVLIQADSSVGYQLPSFELCVFASQSYSYVNWEQMCGRFLRMDKPSRTTFMYLLTAGESIDQAVYDAIKRKEDFKINLYKKDEKTKTH